MTRTPARTFRNLLSIVAIATTAALALSACTSEGPDVTPNATESPAPEPTTPAEVAIPSTPVGERMQFFVDLLNQTDDIEVVDLEGIFDKTFTDAVSLQQVAELLNQQIRPAQPILITGYQGSESQAIAQAAGTIGEPFAIQLSLTTEGLVDGFALTPASSPDPAESLGEVEERLEALTSTVRYSVTRVAPDGTAEVLLEQGAMEPSPMASMFKLYVLLAVHQQVAAGALSWSDELTVTSETRSLPSGRLQDEPDGTTVTVREAAVLMISISDNTATDMLIDRVGRAAVEQAVVAAGHHDPAALTPFLTTREMFMLALGSDARAHEVWADATVDMRRAMLDSLHIDLDAIDLATMSTEPFWQHGLDWFATPADVAAAHEALANLDDPDVTAALTANPGVVIDADEWSEVAFKGGSSFGVATGSWRAVAPDGTTLSVVMMASADDAEALAQEQVELFSLMTDVFTLAATN